MHTFLVTFRFALALTMCVACRKLAEADWQRDMSGELAAALESSSRASPLAQWPLFWQVGRRACTTSNGRARCLKSRTSGIYKSLRFFHVQVSLCVRVARVFRTASLDVQEYVDFLAILYARITTKAEKREFALSV